MLVENNCNKIDVDRHRCLKISCHLCRFVHNGILLGIAQRTLTTQKSPSSQSLDGNIGGFFKESISLLLDLVGGMAHLSARLS